jgi:uncharacterized membrane protein YraQ (UPF0718 family)
MVWLNDLVGAGVETVGFDPATRLGGSVQFFVYDVIKIFILLSVLIFVISYIQSHFPPERTRALPGGRSGTGANVLAALLGTLTPFCSCSSIPLFIGFSAAELPLAVTFSFLISSPLVRSGPLRQPGVVSPSAVRSYQRARRFGPKPEWQAGRNRS